jgi:cytochrome c
MRAPLLIKILIPLLAISVSAVLLSGVENARAGAFQFPFGLGPVEMAGPPLYRARCEGCHALDRNRYGPSHHDLLGRTAGTQPGYRYSDALSRSRIVWTPAALDEWLQDPGKMVPGTRMDVRITDPEQRRLIIEFLKTNPK